MEDKQIDSRRERNILALRKCLQRDTERVCDRYDLPYDRVYDILEISATYQDFTPLHEVIDSIDIDAQRGCGASDIYFWPSLAMCVDILGPDRSLELFRLDHIRKLAEYEWLAETLQGEVVPRLSLGNLIDTLKGLETRLRSHRRDILENGKPRLTPDHPHWFENWVLRIYPFDLSDTPQQEQVDSSELPPPLDLSEQDEDKLISKRPLIYGLKLSILRVLLQALEANQSSLLWQKCFDLIETAVTTSDCDLFLRADKEYDRLLNRKHRFRPDLIAHGWRNSSGGLSDIMQLIGFVEQEIRIGTFTRFREDYPQFDPWCQILRDQELACESYYRAVKLWGVEDVDRAMEQTLALEAKEGRFWDEFTLRVNNALSNDLFDVISLKVPVRRELRDPFCSMIKAMSESLASHLSAMESPLSMEISTNKSITVGQLTFSPDFRSVRIGAKRFTLTPREAQVVQILYEAKRDGTIDTSLAYLIGEVAPNTSHKRLKDIFPNESARKAVISNGEGKGTYRLNF